MIAAWRVGILLNASLGGSGFNKLTSQAMTSERAVARVQTKILGLPSETVAALVGLGKKMASALEEIARR